MAAVHIHNNWHNHAVHLHAPIHGIHQRDDLSSTWRNCWRILDLLLQPSKLHPRIYLVSCNSKLPNCYHYSFQVGIVFYLMFFIPNLGVTWMNYAIVASCFSIIPLIWMTKERYNRLDLDDWRNIKHTTSKVWLWSYYNALLVGVGSPGALGLWNQGWR